MTKKQAKTKPQFDVVPSYKGGHTLLPSKGSGHVYEFQPYHRLANHWGWVSQHRLVAEDKLGRELRPGETVHHIDENPQNNHPDNLRIMSRSEHHRYHALKRAEKTRIDISYNTAKEALGRHKGIKPAAKELGVSHSTLRNRYPELCRPYRRISPTKIDDPRDIETILKYAPDPNIGVKWLGKQLNMSPRTILRICETHGIRWKKKTRVGEKHRTYRGKPIHR